MPCLPPCWVVSPQSLPMSAARRARRAPALRGPRGLADARAASRATAHSVTWPRRLRERTGADSTLPFPQKKEQAQEVCSGLFVLDKLFALFVPVSYAVLGRGVKALRNAKANSASSPLRTWHCRRPSSWGGGRWDNRNRLKEIAQKPTILIMIVIRNLEIVSIHEEKR